MGITLVARGRDHMINTPIQILLYQALGKTPPEFAHLPMMLAPDGQKLSKRHGAVSVGEYRDKGIPPAALLNYLVRFGWSYGDQEIFSLDDLTAKFDWGRCGTSDGKFDAKKLASIAFEHLKQPELTSDASYVAGVRPYLDARGLTNVDEGKLVKAIGTIRERAQTLLDAAEALDYYFREPPVTDEKAAKKFLVPEKAAKLPLLREVLANANDWTARALDAEVTGFLGARGIELKEVAQPARVALTGRSASPGIFEVLEVLGKEVALARIDRAIALVGSASAP
jgi:glutamyl-tRNA synthetase